MLKAFQAFRKTCYLAHVLSTEQPVIEQFRERQCVCLLRVALTRLHPAQLIVTQDDWWGGAVSAYNSWPAAAPTSDNMQTATLVVLTTLVALAAADKMYTSKFDTIDIDKVLGNDRILSQYIKCLMEEGSCTNEGRELKSEYRGWGWLIDSLFSNHNKVLSRN